MWLTQTEAMLMCMPSSIVFLQEWRWRWRRLDSCRAVQTCDLTPWVSGCMKAGVWSSAALVFFNHPTSPYPSTINATHIQITPDHQFNLHADRLQRACGASQHYSEYIAFALPPRRPHHTPKSSAATPSRDGCCQHAQQNLLCHRQQEEARRGG